MLQHVIRLTVIFSGLVLATACGTDATTATARLTIQTPCAADADCPASFQCEIETEHGVTASSCQSDDPNGTCPAGYETEVEHGQTFCKAHGGAGSDDGAGTGADDGAGTGADDGAGTGADDGAGTGSDDGSGAGSVACTTSADCPAGQECEVEIEHGQTTSTCKLHGTV